MIANLIALSVLASQGPVVEEQTFVIGYQEGTLDPKSLEKIRTCTKPEQLNPIITPLGYVAKEHKKGITFIFKSTDKLDEYIKQKKKLMEFYVQSGAGERTKPWEKTFKVKQLPDFFSGEVNSLTRTTINTGINPETPIIPQLECRITLKLGEREVFTDLHMEREVTSAYKEKLRSISPVEGGVTPDNKRFPRDPDSAYAAMPWVNFTLNGMVTKSWGTPMTNSKAAGVMEAYYKDLRTRTEDAEEKLRSLYREFFQGIEGQDDLWRQLRAMNGRPANDMSPELKDAVSKSLMNHKPSRFLDAKDLESFLDSAQVVKTNPMMILFIVGTSHTGEFSMSGYEL